MKRSETLAKHEKIRAEFKTLIFTINKTKAYEKLAKKYKFSVQHIINIINN